MYLDHMAYEAEMRQESGLYVSANLINSSLLTLSLINQNDGCIYGHHQMEYIEIKFHTLLLKEGGRAQL